MKMTSRCVLLVVLLLSIWLLAGCGGGDSGGAVNPPGQVTILDTVTEDVPSSGGTIGSDAIAAAPDVEFPSGVLSTDASVTMEVLSDVPISPPNTGLTLLGNPVSLAVDGADLAADGHLIVRPGKPAGAGKAVLAGYLVDGQWVLTPAPQAAGSSPAITVMLSSEAQAAASSKSDKRANPLVVAFFEVVMILRNETMQVYRWNNGWKAANTAGWPGGEISGTRRVLLVHGILGSHRDFDTLAPKLAALQGMSVYAVSYSYGENIDSLGTKLAQIIGNRVTSGKTDVVAHSMGGLVSRSAIEKHNAKAKVSKLITCGSPHGGIPADAIGTLVNFMDARFRGWLPEFYDLMSGSPFLTALNADSDTGCYYYSMAGSNPTGSWLYLAIGSVYRDLLREDNDGMVPKSSATRSLGGEAYWDLSDLTVFEDANHNNLINTMQPPCIPRIISWLDDTQSGGDRPTVTLNAPEVDQSTGLARITGTMAGADSAQVVHNGVSLNLAVPDGGDYEYNVVLAHGTNTIYVRARNAAGYTDSASRLIEFDRPPEDFNFRVTLVWDGEGDVDLHTWDPNNEHSSYIVEQIGTGELDIDNTWANGPENFTNRYLTQGRYRVGVNAFSRCAGRNAYVRVTVNAGANAGLSRVFGPYLFEEPNGNSGYPVTGNTVSWWRPCDVVVYGDRIDIVDPDTVQMPLGLVPRSYHGSKRP